MKASQIVIVNVIGVGNDLIEAIQNQNLSMSKFATDFGNREVKSITECESQFTHEENGNELLKHNVRARFYVERISSDPMSYEITNGDYVS